MSKKALIIDDDEMTIMSLKNLLKQGGYEFEIAENGNEGVEKVKASSFDLSFGWFKKFKSYSKSFLFN